MRRGSAGGRYQLLAVLAASASVGVLSTTTWNRMRGALAEQEAALRAAELRLRRREEALRVRQQAVEREALERARTQEHREASVVARELKLGAAIRAATPAPPRVIFRAGAAADDCAWVLHSGATLGGTLGSQHPWQRCADAGQHCPCMLGEVRFGTVEAWSAPLRSPEDGVFCSSEHFHAFSAKGRGHNGTAVCQCRSTDSGGSLSVAQRQCLRAGSDCAGVTCTTTGVRQSCSPRDGVPFLKAEAGSESYVRRCRRRDPAHEVDGAPTIFVSIASYRDKDVKRTLRSLFRKSNVPRRIFVGLICQRLPKDPPCVPEEWLKEDCGMDAHFCPSDQLRVREFDAERAEGPTHARALASALYRGEHFFMMIDAHSRFVSDWDSLLIRMHAQCSEQSKRCVLSHYPEGLNMSDPENPSPLNTPIGTPLEGRQHTAYLCNGDWNIEGYVRNVQALSMPRPARPLPSPFSGAGLMFGPGRMIEEVPFDPMLRFVWDGEEFLYNVRLWTWGYDLFAPSDNILFHHYGRVTSPGVFTGQRYASLGGSIRRQSYRRLQYILEMPVDDASGDLMVPPATKEKAVKEGLPRYGLGPRRSLADFWRYAKSVPVTRSGEIGKGHRGYFCRNCAAASPPADCYAPPPKD